MASVIDFHTHILPQIDDGSSSVEESIKLLRLEAEQGIQHVVATPHFYANHEFPEKFIEKRKEACEKLKEAIANEEGLPKVSVGAEVYFFEGMSDCEFLSQMAIEGTDCVMVEMPMSSWSERNLQELAGIRQKQKLTPIIAHLDRYAGFIRPRAVFDKVAQLPVLVQVNAGFFTRRSTRKLALRLLSEGKIHLIGTDCHNTETRKPQMSEALEIIRRYMGAYAIKQINSLETSLFYE